MSSIVDIAQVIDTFLGHWSPSGSAAINFYFNDNGNWDVDVVSWDYSLCDEEMLVAGQCLPFLQTSGIVFTAGYALTVLIFFPMALMDLKVRRPRREVYSISTILSLNHLVHTGKCDVANQWLYCVTYCLCGVCLFVRNERREP